MRAGATGRCVRLSSLFKHGPRQTRTCSHTTYKALNWFWFVEMNFFLPLNPNTHTHSCTYICRLSISKTDSTMVVIWICEITKPFFLSFFFTKPFLSQFAYLSNGVNNTLYMTEFCDNYNYIIFNSGKVFGM